VVKDASVEPLTEVDIKAHLKVFADTGIISKYGIPDKYSLRRQPAQDERRQNR
jgi:hypothetical protein